MPFSCLKCKDPVNENQTKSFIKCDGCERPVHVNCSDLSAAEIKCFELRPNSKRRFKYICMDCEQGLHQLPKILSLVTDLKQEINKLNEKIENISNPVSSNTSLSPMVMEEIISEISERNKRSSNLLIYGVTEAGSSKKEQSDLDCTLISDILNNLGSSATQQIKPVRLGKYDASNTVRSRPIKVNLFSADLVQNVIRNVKKLKGLQKFSALAFSYDRTPRQIELYKTVKQELLMRLQNGEENLKIIYRNGVPTIINQSHSEN